MTPADPLSPAPAWGHSSGALHLAAEPPELAPEASADRLALAQLMYRYGWSFDERRADVLADCFVEDATWEASVMGTDTIGPHVGRERIMGFMTGFWPEQDDQRRHMIMNVLIENLTSSNATVLSYHLLMSAAGGTITPVTAGFYRASALKTSSGWKLATLLAGYDVPF
jgi:hypothetical protein